MKYMLKELISYLHICDRGFLRQKGIQSIPRTCSYQNKSAVAQRQNNTRGKWKQNRSIRMWNPGYLLTTGLFWLKFSHTQNLFQSIQLILNTPYILNSFTCIMPKAGLVTLTNLQSQSSLD